MNNPIAKAELSETATSTVTQPLAGHRTTLTLLMLAFTLSICDRMILSILFPEIKAEFGLSDTQLGMGECHSRCFMPPWACRLPGCQISTVAKSLL